MDALSEVLRTVKLDSAIFINAEFSEPWCLASPEASVLGPLLTSAGGHVIIYHLLCEGQAYAQIPGGERVTLSPGDLITFPHGHAHALGGGTNGISVDAGSALPGVLEHGLELLQVGGGGAPAHFICGFLVCDAQLCQAFVAGLPPLIVVNLRDDPSGQWMEASLKFSVGQAGARGAGSSAMLTMVSEALFAETLRRYARDLPVEQKGWFAGARDPAVGRALTLLHHKPADPWTVAELARQTGVSRTVLAERFRHFLDESPMAYLTRWRLQLAARALATSSHSVAQVALEVGYESEAAFNRAFKRAFGQPPAKYRKDKAEQRAVLGSSA